MFRTTETTLTTDVLIVGAGPTGMALSRTLAQAGVRHIIVDRQPTGQNTSRAAVIHAHTLEVLDDVGVGDLRFDFMTTQAVSLTSILAASGPACRACAGVR